MPPPWTDRRESQWRGWAAPAGGSLEAEEGEKETL
jgi:hypothetical protein